MTARVMNKIKAYLPKVIACVALIIVISSVVYFQKSDSNIKQRNGQAGVVKVIKNSEIDKQSIAQYVISASGERLSDAMAAELIDSAFNTKFPLLILAIAKVESNYNTMARSSVGASGMFQIRYSVWGRKLEQAGIINNKRDLYDYRKAVRACEFILSELYNKTGNLNTALKKYVGSTKTSYARKVLSSLGELYIISRVMYNEKESKTVGGDSLYTKKDSTSNKNNTK